MTDGKDKDASPDADVGDLMFAMMAAQDDSISAPTAQKKHKGDAHGHQHRHHRHENDGESAAAAVAEPASARDSDLPRKRSREESKNRADDGTATVVDSAPHSKKRRLGSSPPPPSTHDFSSRILLDGECDRSAINESDPDDEDEEDDPQGRDDSGTKKPRPSGPDENLMTVEPPHYRKIEELLGPERAEDSYCYVCDTVDPLERGSLAEEVVRLVEYIPNAIYEYKNKIAVARKVLDRYEKTIRKPANKKCTVGGKEKVREWTLRGIYVHIMEHMNTTDVILDQALEIAQYTIKSAYRGKTFVASKTKSRSTLRDEDLAPTKDGVAIMNSLLQKLLIITDKREKYHLARLAASTTASPSARTSSGGGGGGHTVGSMGGRSKDGAVKMSALMGDKMSQNDGNRDERTTYMDRNTKRTFV